MILDMCEIFRSLPVPAERGRPVVAEVAELVLDGARLGAVEQRQLGLLLHDAGVEGAGHLREAARSRCPRRRCSQGTRGLPTRNQGRPLFSGVCVKQRFIFLRFKPAVLTP